jgi:hypothetical protein
MAERATRKNESVSVLRHPAEAGGNAWLSGAQRWQLLFVLTLAFFLAWSMALAGQFTAGSEARTVLHFKDPQIWMPPAPVPNLGWAAFLALTPALAFITRALNRRTGALAYSLAVMGTLAALTKTITWTGAPDQSVQALYVLPYALLLGLLSWTLQGRVPDCSQQKTWIAFALAGVLAWGMGSRLEELAWGANLLPDARYYRHVAQVMSGPYDAASREPLWPLLMKGWFRLAGDSEMSVRVLTIGLSLGVIGVAYKLFRDYCGEPLVGLLVAGLLSQHAFLVRLSVQGLREEAYMIAILCFIYVIFVAHGRWSLSGQTIGLTVSGAALLLLRLNSAVFVFPLALFWVWKRFGWRNPKGWMQLALVAGCLLAAVAPHLIHNARAYGDPLFSLNLHAVAARNIEFVLVKHVGCAGCPTAVEMEGNLYSGAPVTTLEYLFGMHTVRELAVGLVEGYRDLYILPTPLFLGLLGSQLPGFAYVLFLVGLGLVLFKPYREMVVVVLLLSNLIPFFLGHAILDLRLGIHVVPFVSFVLAYAIWRCFTWGSVLYEAVHARIDAFPGGRATSAARVF